LKSFSRFQLWTPPLFLSRATAGNTGIFSLSRLGQAYTAALPPLILRDAARRSPLPLFFPLLAVVLGNDIYPFFTPPFASEGGVGQGLSVFLFSKALYPVVSRERGARSPSFFPFFFSFFLVVPEVGPFRVAGN